MSYKSVLPLFFCFLLGFCSWFQDDVWVWDVDGEKITKRQIEDAYEGYLFWWSLQLQATPEQLLERLKDIGSMTNPKEKELYSQLTRKSFFKGDGRQTPLFKKLLLVSLKAEQSGFLDDPVVQKKLAFMNRFFLFNLYMQDKVDLKSIEVSDADAMSRLSVLRRTNPQYASLSIIKGKEAAKQQILMERAAAEQELIFNDIRDEYRIISNKDINEDSILLGKGVKSQSEDVKKEEGKK